MALFVLLGGARSGKSQLAVRIAAQAAAPVTFVATAEARDAEMEARIAAHRAERPREWDTLEEPCELERALAAVERSRVVVVDCLSLWAANLLERGDEPGAVVAAAERAASVAAARNLPAIAVSNEVGLGIVPATPLGRAYRDLLGIVNGVWVEAAVRSALVVAGRLLELPHPSAVASWLSPHREECKR